MVAISVIRNLLNDDASLHAFLMGKVVSFEDVKRRLFLLERERNSNLPDHYYRLQLERDLQDINSLSKVLSKGIANLADAHLTLINERIYVCSDMLESWQQLLPSMPPLLLTAAKIWPKSSNLSIDRFFADYILPNTRYTCLHCPDITDFKDIQFPDLHVHLNGITETDHVWLDSLKNPEKVYRYLRKAASDPAVQEQYEQEGRAINDYRFYELLYIARQIRALLFYLVLDDQNRSIKDRSASQLLSSLLFITPSSEPSGGHPFAFTLEKKYSLNNDLPYECLMYVMVIDELSRRPSERLASLFHFYLLILGLNNRMLVQQLHQFGFDQFQKHTLNKIREFSEENYYNRFLQVSGNELKYLSLMEGRFSPKGTERELSLMLQKIYEGKTKADKIYLRSFELSLVAHFIKTKERKDHVDPFIRHKQLRIESWGKAHVLEKYIPKIGYKHPRIVGIDAAANELHAPPEVFAPVFRKLRGQNHVHHATFHVGEDFYHQLSGLRAMFEAVVFLDLKENDRIGHGVAAGLCPKLWSDIIGPQMLIRQGEWFDTLVFLSHINGDSTALTNEIQKLGENLYDGRYTTEEYNEAWLMRKYCPMHFFNLSLGTFDHIEWAYCRSETHSPKAQALFKLYHSESVRKRYDKIIEIETMQFCSISSMVVVQQKVLKMLVEKKIVIEALPTSNIRIGHYENISGYHLWIWKERSDFNSIPDIVIGSDDPGIFATNIFNEYAHLHGHLVTHKEQPMPYIKKLLNNGIKYRFKAP